MDKIKLQSNKGFTLVELIVALGLFIVVMTVATSALLSLTDINRKVESMRIAYDNLNLALESMARELRAGKAYTCGKTSVIPALNLASVGSDCNITEGKSSIGFYSQDGDTIVYRKNGNAIERQRSGEPGFSAITSPNIVIDRLTFGVFGTSPFSPPSTDLTQPKVIISISGTAGTGETESKFNIHTSVTQRIQDI